MIYVRTCAYNAEKTIRRAMDSVLNQTYRDITYYVLDNGSTDRTGEIIKEYALNDSRVVPFYNKVNRDLTENPQFWLVSHELKEEDYFCILDADDEYDLTFLEKMISFVERYHLDIAACGTRFINAANNIKMEDRKLTENRVLTDKEDYNQYFSEIHWNLRQVWGKVYSAKAAKARYETYLPDWFPKAYGGDTVNVYECVKASQAIGVYAKVLHSYYMSSKSVSYQWIEGREDADEILFQKSVELLMEKCGEVSQNNIAFLCAVYYHAVMDTLAVLFSAELPVSRKCALLKKIMEKPLTGTMIGCVEEKAHRAFVERVVLGILQMCNTECEETNLTACYSMLAAFTEWFSKLISQKDFRLYVTECSKIVGDIALGDYEAAVNEIICFLNVPNVMARTEEKWLELGLNIAAISNQEEKYIVFSKKMICWKWENGHHTEAWQELQEWLEMLPEDSELRNMERAFRK